MNEYIQQKNNFIGQRKHGINDKQAMQLMVLCIDSSFGQEIQKSYKSDYKDYF